MDKKIVKFVFVILFLAGVSVAWLYAGPETIVITPVSGGVIQPPLPHTIPPPSNPIDAEIDINPDTLNLKNNMKFITVYIELEEKYSVNDIDAVTVIIAEVNGVSVVPVSAVESPKEIGDYDEDGIADLMVKFKADDVKNILPIAESVVIKVAGNLHSGIEFSGKDEIKVISPGIHKEREEEYAASAVTDTEGEFTYNLGDNLPDFANILNAFVWIDNRGKSKGQLKIKNFGKEPLLYRGKIASRYYLHSKEGNEVEWDITETVKENWNNGLKKVVILLNYDDGIAAGTPLLIVTYDGDESDEDEAITRQNLIRIAPRFNFSKSKGKKFIILFYSESEIEGINEKSLEIYGWDKNAGEWKLVEGTINIIDNNIITSDTRFSKYQIMTMATASVSETVPSEEFKLGEVYSFPNPAKQSNPTIYFECGIADKVEIRIYNIAAELVHTIELTGMPQVINGKYVYEYTWDVSNIASGVYLYHVRAIKGNKELAKLKKLAVVK